MPWISRDKLRNFDDLMRYETERRERDVKKLQDRLDSMERVAGAFGFTWTGSHNLFSPMTQTVTTNQALHALYDHFGLTFKREAEKICVAPKSADSEPKRSRK